MLSDTQEYSKAANSPNPVSQTMSHFTSIVTVIVDTDGLVKSLADLGYNKVEVHEEAQHLRGFMGDKRKQTAEVVIRKKHVGRMSNDIGFKRRENNTYEAIISAYDRGRHNNKWLKKLTQRYAYHVACDKLAEQGFDMVSEKQADGEIRMVLRRMA